MTVITFKVPMTSAASFAYGDFKEMLETEFEAEVSPVQSQVFTVRVADDDTAKVVRAGRNTPFVYQSNEVE